MPAPNPLASAYGRLAADTKWSMTDRVEGTAAARAKSPGSVEYFYDQVDPNRELDELERRRRAESAKRAHFTRLSIKAAKARRGGGDRAS